MKFSQIYFFLVLLSIFGLSASNLQAEDSPYTFPVDYKSGIVFPNENGNSDSQIASMRYEGQQAQFPSHSGHFLIHYDTSGVHAVDLTDNNMNGIPDYVDSVAFYFDYSYLVAIDSMGFKPPYSDNGLGGSDAHDVYIIEFLQEDIPRYGLTLQESTVTNDPHEFDRWITYTKIDNNYSIKDSVEVLGEMRQLYRTTGIQGMKITATHEYHHSIQLSYGVQTPWSLMLNEMVSTWMEYRVHPDTRDYLQYVEDLFFHPDKYPFAFGDAQVGYSYAIFGQFMHKKFGDRVFVRMFELIGEDIDGYGALDSAMKEQGSSLTAAWRDFIPWLYYTGDRAIPGEFFDHADEFPTLPNYLNEDPISFDSGISINKDGRLKLFEFRMYSFILPSKSENTDDTLTIILVNPDMKSAIIQNKLKRNLFSILCSENDGSSGMRPVPGTAYFYSVEAETDIIDSIYINSGYCTTGIAYAYPNPYKPGNGETMNFPLPSNAMINDIAHLSIMRSDMVSVYSANLPILADNLNRVLRWDNIPNDLSSGIYIFKVTYKDEIKLGKFAVIR